MASAIRLVAPMMLVGATALSVETRTKRSTPAPSATSTSVRVPTTLLVTASSGCSSISGTCLWAAAWKTIAGCSAANDRAQPIGVADVGDHRADLHLRMRLAQPVGDVEDAVLAVADQDEPRRPRMRDLAADLRADRPAGAGDQHDPALQVHPGVGLRADRGAAQQIADVDLAQPVDADAAVEQLEQARQRPCRYAGARARFEYRADDRAGRGRHRDDHLGGVEARHRVLEAGERRDDRHPVDPLAQLGRMIVEVADRVHAELRVLLDLARDERAGVAGAGDQDAARRRGGLARPRPPPFRDDPLRHADPGDAGQRQEPVDREDRSREERRNAGHDAERHEEREDGTRRRDGRHHHQQVGQAGVAPIPAIEAEGVEHRGLGQHAGHDGVGKGPRQIGRLREEPVEPEDERSEHAEDDREEIGDEDVAVTHGRPRSARREARARRSAG